MKRHKFPMILIAVVLMCLLALFTNSLSGVTNQEIKVISTNKQGEKPNGQAQNSPQKPDAGNTSILLVKNSNQSPMSYHPGQDQQNRLSNDTVMATRH